MKCILYNLHARSQQLEAMVILCRQATANQKFNVTKESTQNRGVEHKRLMLIVVCLMNGVAMDSLSNISTNFESLNGTRADHTAILPLQIE